MRWAEAGCAGSDAVGVTAGVAPLSCPRAPAAGAHARCGCGGGGSQAAWKGGLDACCCSDALRRRRRLNTRCDGRRNARTRSACELMRWHGDGRRDHAGAPPAACARGLLGGLRAKRWRRGAAVARFASRQPRSSAWRPRNPRLRRRSEKPLMWGAEGVLTAEPGAPRGSSSRRGMMPAAEVSTMRRRRWARRWRAQQRGLHRLRQTRRCRAARRRPSPPGSDARRNAGWLAADGAGGHGELAAKHDAVNAAERLVGLSSATPRALRSRACRVHAAAGCQAARGDRQGCPPARA
jgi:hypothetical protein